MIRRPPRSTLFPYRRSSDLRRLRRGEQLHGFPERRDRKEPEIVHDSGLGQVGRREHQRACRSEEHTSELQSQSNLVCRLLLEKENGETTPHELRMINTTFSL